jgi:threonine synthase
MNGFIKFFKVGIISELPKILGVQSRHANPVYQYYSETDPSRRAFKPVDVKSSVAQAAMIGNPVSMPRVIDRVQRYDQLAGRPRVFFVEVDEQDIMDWELLANRSGHNACTHGGETLAGLIAARRQGLIDSSEIAVLDSTAHALKFSEFQTMYFERRFPAEFEISPRPELINKPLLIKPDDLEHMPGSGKKLSPGQMKQFVERVSDEIAKILKLTQ